MTGQTTPTSATPSLHEVLARGIDKGLRDVGADLTGCTPSMLTGHIIRELRAAGMNPTELRRMLTEAESALRDLSKKCLVVKTSLDKPYPDAPHLSPWTQYVQRPASRAYNLAVEIRGALRDSEAAVPPTVSAPRPTGEDTP